MDRPAWACGRRRAARCTADVHRGFNAAVFKDADGCGSCAHADDVRDGDVLQSGVRTCGQVAGRDSAEARAAGLCQLAATAFHKVCAEVGEGTTRTDPTGLIYLWSEGE